MDLTFYSPEFRFNPKQVAGREDPFKGWKVVVTGPTEFHGLDGIIESSEADYDRAVVGLPAYLERYEVMKLSDLSLPR